MRQFNLDFVGRNRNVTILMLFELEQQRVKY